MKSIDILKRLFFEYTQKHLKKIVLSVFFSLLVAGSTSSIAYLLDPAIKKPKKLLLLKILKQFKGSLKLKL